MVKQKRRYILVEILLEDRNTKSLQNALFQTIYDQVAALHGDYGIGIIKSSFQVKVCDSNTNISVIRISDEGCKIITSTLPFVNCIGASTCTLRMLFKGASMRTVERFLIKENLRELYSRLRKEKTPSEMAKIQTAIVAITGSKVAHIKM